MTSQIITLLPAAQTRAGRGGRYGRTINALLFAGLVGGAAEILWVALYSQLSPLSAAEVSRQVALSIIPAAADVGIAPLLGIFIHLAISVLLVFAFGLSVWLPVVRRYPPVFVIVAAAAALIVVWAVNFFIVLPHVNPAFVTLMPYPVTFFSKLLFGLAAGWCLYRVEIKTRPAWITVLNK